MWLERANKTGFNLMIVHFYIGRKLDIYDAIHNFSVWLRIGSNPPDIKRFRRENGKYIFAINMRITLR